MTSSDSSSLLKQQSSRARRIYVTDYFSAVERTGIPNDGKMNGYDISDVQE